MPSNNPLGEITAKLGEGFLRLMQPDGAIQDPVTDICDSRPTAEVGKSFLKLGLKEAAEKCFRWALQQQGANGSWHEITEDFNEENTLSTAVIGKSLLDAYLLHPQKEYLAAAQKALRYVLGKEFSPGHFLKAYSHYPDMLNVNAACAAFMTTMLHVRNDPIVRAARDRALLNTVRHQFKDGALPYTTSERLFPYEDHLNVRDLYYHSVTLYYLTLSDPHLQNKYFQIASPKAFRWLTRTIDAKNAPWHASKVIFTIGAIGFYGYSAYCFKEQGDEQRFERCIAKLQQLQLSGGLFSRYEPSKMGDLVKGCLGELFELNAVAPTGYSIATRLFRLRKRLAHELKNRRKQLPSAFYSAQIFNALTECMHQ